MRAQCTHGSILSAVLTWPVISASSSAARGDASSSRSTNSLHTASSPAAAYQGMIDRPRTDRTTAAPADSGAVRCTIPQYHPTTQTLPVLGADGTRVLDCGRLFVPSQIACDAACGLPIFACSATSSGASSSHALPLRSTAATAPFVRVCNQSPNTNHAESCTAECARLASCHMQHARNSWL